MIQSIYSKELENFAKSLDDTYDDFIRFLGIVPQMKGVDQLLAEFVKEKPEATHDDIMLKYWEFTILNRC